MWSFLFFILAIFPLLSFSSIEHLYSLLIIFFSSRKGSLSSPRNSPRHATSVQVDYFDNKENERYVKKAQNLCKNITDGKWNYNNDGEHSQDCSSPRRGPPPAPPRSSRCCWCKWKMQIYFFFHRKGFSQEPRIDLLLRPDTAGPGRPEVNAGVGGKASNNDK